MFQFDMLSIVFVILIFLGIIPNLFYSFGYLSHIKRKYHYLLHYFAFIVSMFGVVLAKNALVFLFFWEIMSLTSWQLILTEADNKDSIKAGRFYFFMTHFGFVFLLLFFMIVTNADFDISFEKMHLLSSSFGYPTLLFLLY